MGIFTKKTPEEIELEKQKEIKKTLEKYGLDLENYTIQDIVKKNSDNLRNIASELVAIGFHKVRKSSQSAGKVHCDFQTSSNCHFAVMTT